MARFIVLLLAAAAALSPLAVQAAEGGAVSLEIGGETVEFPLWAGQSDWSGSEVFASVNIYARPTDEATWARFKTLALGFTVTGAGVDSPELSLSRVAADGIEKLHAGADAGGLAVTVDTRAVAGYEMTLSGTFSGRMGPSDNFGRDIDLSDPVPVTGRFSVTLGPVE